MVKNLPANAEAAGIMDSISSWEDPLEEEMAIHSSILARIITKTGEPCGLQAMGSQRVGHDQATKHTLTVFSSVQSLSLSNSLRPHGLQYTRLPCPSPTPGVCSNSRPESR